MSQFLTNLYYVSNNNLILVGIGGSRIVILLSIDATFNVYFQMEGQDIVLMVLDIEGKFESTLPAKDFDQIA